MLEIRHQSIRQGHSTRDAYDDLYEQRDILLRDSFYLWLIDLLHPQSGKLLLDISCGQGRLVQLAEQRGLHAAGVDFSIAGLLKGVRDAPEAGWVVGDGECLPHPDDSVDYVTHIGSLEHYEHPIQGAREIARVLKPAGRACILLPNAYGLLGNIRHVYATGEIFDDGQPLQRYATRRTWEAVLAQGGLAIERVVPYGEIDRPRTVRDLFWTLARPAKIVRALFAALTPINLANHFVFICRPALAHPDDTASYPMLSAQ